jgi:flagellar basal body-associated protein FliL
MTAARNDTGKTSIALIAIIVIICLGAAVAVFVKYGDVLGASNAAKKPGLTQWKLEEFLVNLGDREESRYLKVNLVLEVSGNVQAGGEGGSNPEEIKARDAVIGILTRKTYRDLLSDQGKTSLKAELKSALNGVLDGVQVENIYFTSFAMQ